LTLTNPSKLPLFFFIFPFALLFLILFTLSNIVLRRLFMLSDYHKKRREMISIFFALFVTIVISMQSIGQLTLRDFIIIMLIVSISIFYVNKTSFTS
jgi:hypothetical protein